MGDLVVCCAAHFRNSSATCGTSKVSSRQESWPVTRMSFNGLPLADAVYSSYT